MSEVNCFDVVRDILDEAGKEFKGEFVEDAEKVSDLRGYCDMIQSLAEQFGGIVYEVSVDQSTKAIAVALTCEEFETKVSTSKFFNLFEVANKVKFRPAENEKVELTFIFSGVWKRKN